MYYRRVNSVYSSEEEDNMERDIYPSCWTRSQNQQAARGQSFLPSIGHVYKEPKKKMSPFDRAVQKTDKAAARAKKKQEENIAAQKSSFKHHLTPLGVAPVLPSGSRTVEHAEYLPRPPVKCLCGVDRAYPLKPIQGKQSPAGSVLKKRGKHCQEALKPREDQTCSPYDFDGSRTSIQVKFLYMEYHLRLEADKVIKASKYERNTSSVMSVDESTDSSTRSLSSINSCTPEELRVLSPLRSPTPVPPPKPVTPRSNVSRMRSQRILSKSHCRATAIATDERPSLPKYSSKMKECPVSTVRREHPLINPELSLMQTFQLLRAESWEKKVEGLACVRALAENQGDVIIANLHDITLMVVQEVKNLRSAVSRAAITTLGHMYVHLKKAMDKELDSTAGVLLQKSGECNNFIREAVELALGLMVQNCSPGRVLKCLVTTGLNHRNVAVRRCTALHLQKLAELLGAPRILNSKTDLPRCFVVSICKLALDSAQEVRSHARNALGILSTHKDFNKMVHKFVPQKDKASIRDIVTKLRRH